MDAKKYNFATVCINPCYVSYASELLKDSNVKVCTVIGFPLGANTTKIKVEEAVDAALEELPDDSLIKPFLVANKAEVKRMCITEYDEARTFAEQREDGALDILVSLIKKGLLTLAQAAEEAHMTVAEFEAKTGLKA